MLDWLKAVGSHVERGEALVEIETEKPNVVLEASVTETLDEILITGGEMVPVGTVIAMIDDGRPVVSAASAQRSTPTEADAPSLCHRPRWPPRRRLRPVRPYRGMNACEPRRRPGARLGRRTSILRRLCPAIPQGS